MEEQLASSQSELEELKEQMRLGVLSVECGEGDAAATVAQAANPEQSQEAQQLRARVTELEEELAKQKGEAEGQSQEDGDIIKQLNEKVKALQAALDQKDSDEDSSRKAEETAKSLQDKVVELEAALAESRTSEATDGDQARRLQDRVTELEGELRERVPRSELQEVQVTLRIQCEQLARERADVARRLNDALLELERLRPPLHRDGDDEEEEDHSEPSVMSGVQRYLFLSTERAFMMTM